MKISNDEVRVKVIHGGVGAVSESDVMLANASNALNNKRSSFNPVVTESAAEMVSTYFTNYL